MYREVVAAALATAIFLTAGCQRIEEPWVREDHPLIEERALAQEVKLALRHRFVEVQTDR